MNLGDTPNFAAIDGQSQSLPTGVYGSTFLTNNDELIIDNCTFINNSKGSKGAVHTNNNTKVTNSIFIGNSANSYSGYGGAIRSDNGYLDIEKCIFVNNSAYYSVSSWSGSVSGNDGTAIYNTAGDLYIKDSIIISNITAHTTNTGISNGSRTRRLSRFSSPARLMIRSAMRLWPPRWGKTFLRRRIILRASTDILQ